MRGGERWPKKGQPDRTENRHQHAQNAREEDGLEEEVADRQIVPSPANVSRNIGSCVVTFTR
jgi:hypothetical protein